MGIMVEEFKSSPKRDFRNATKQANKKFSRASLLEVLSQGGSISSYTAEDGTIRMKILVKKQDLKKIMNNNNNNNAATGPHRDHRATSVTPSSLSSSQMSSIERRLIDLKRKKKANAAAKNINNSSSWRPVLQSIPEEQY